MTFEPCTLSFSFSRLWVISRNTWTEIIRQKFFYIFLLFGTVAIVSSNYFSEFSIQSSNDFSVGTIDRIKFTKDFCLAAILIMGVLIAMVGTAQLLPFEFEHRTIYPVLAKPVYRIEFLLGKYFGMITLLLLTLALMAGIFMLILYRVERELISSIAQSFVGNTDLNFHDVANQIYRQTRDPNLLKALLLIFGKIMIVSAVSLCLSTFATSVIFNVNCSVMIYLAGHLESAARKTLLGGQTLLDTGQAWLSKIILLVITFFIPDLSILDISDKVVLSKDVPTWFEIFKIFSYGLFYSGVVLTLACFIFENKEI